MRWTVNRTAVHGIDRLQVFQSFLVKVRFSHRSFSGSVTGLFLVHEPDFQALLRMPSEGFKFELVRGELTIEVCDEVL